MTHEVKPGDSVVWSNALNRLVSAKFVRWEGPKGWFRGGPVIRLTQSSGDFKAGDEIRTSKVFTVPACKKSMNEDDTFGATCDYKFQGE